MGTIGNSVFTHASQINVNSYYHICLLQFLDDKLLSNCNILEINRTNFHTSNVLAFIFLERSNSTCKSTYSSNPAGGDFNTGNLKMESLRFYSAVFQVAVSLTKPRF